MLPRIDHVLEKVKKYNPSSDERLLQKAYLFSAFAHEGQQRYTGEPYLVHPVAVTDILADLRADDTALVAGLLHDVVEDNHAVSLGEIERRFGPAVAHIVDGVTKIEDNVPTVSRQEREYASLRKVILAMVDDIRVILVKLADRLHNMRTLEGLPEARRPVKAQETLQIYAPIAYRLGLGRVKAELEDLSFRYAYPEDYAALTRLLQERRAYNENFIEETSHELNQLLASVHVEGKVTGRVKHLYSIFTKLRRQGISVEQVYDYMAFRILVPTVKDCYAVLGAIHNNPSWKPVPGRFKDFIALPKENHYRSIHTSVVGPGGQPFEIQIRTFAMHEEAENGLAAHWQYKEGRLSAEDEAATTQWLRSFVESFQEGGGSAQEFLQNLRLDLYPKEVYVFSPRGEVFSLPRGATPLDLAYAIHSDLGHHCVGAKVNGKIVPLKTPLKSGDRVEIIKSPTGKPSRDWLKAAVTSRALSKIRAFLNAQEKAKAIESGRADLDRELKRLKVNLKDAQQSGLFQEALKKASFSDLDALLAAIGYGKVSARDFARRLVPREEEALPASGPAPVSDRSREPALVVRGAPGMAFTFARCCKPIPGEEVVGFVASRGKGLMVHRADCPNVARLRYNPDRFMEVYWSHEAPAAAHEVNLVVETEDRTGMVAEITQIVADAKAPLRHIHADVHRRGYGVVYLTIQVKDKAHLTQIQSRLGRIQGVLGLKRVAR